MSEFGSPGNTTRIAASFEFNEYVSFTSPVECCGRKSALDFRNGFTWCDKIASELNNKLGSVSSSANISWEVNVAFEKTTAVMGQETIFELGIGWENFVFVIEDDEILLTDYDIIAPNILVPEDFAPVIPRQ